MTSIIAYTFDADVHCISCTQKRFTPKDRRYCVKAPYGHTWRRKSYKGAPDTQEVPLDEHYVSMHASDLEGNEIHPVFTTDEHDFTQCGECGQPLETSHADVPVRT